MNDKMLNTFMPMFYWHVDGNGNECNGIPREPFNPRIMGIMDGP